MGALLAGMVGDDGVDMIDGGDPSLADDGQSGSTDAAARPAKKKAKTPARKLGFMLDEKDQEKVAKWITTQREAQEPAMSRRRAVWKRHEWWREGRRFVRLEKKENYTQWRAVLPLGMANAPPTPNKTDRLCRRVGNSLLVDPPIPEAQPAADTEAARDAAQFSTRYLTVLQSSGRLNKQRLLRKSFDKSATFASCFCLVQMDPCGGGMRPRPIMAHPNATDVESPELDPDTQLPAAPDEIKKRYIHANKSDITDDPTKADIQWLPAPAHRLLTGKQVTMLPETATSLRDADAVIVVDWTTLGKLRERFEDEIDALSDEELEDLCKWRPANFKDILPPHVKEPEDQKDEKSGTWKDGQMIVTQTVYARSGAEYPFGAYVVTGGAKAILHRQKWSAIVEKSGDAEGTDPVEIEEALPLPMAQLVCLEDNTFDDPYGIALAEHLGPADEIAASALGFQLEYMFRFGNPNVFLPVGSIIQPKQLSARAGDPIFVNPNGKVEYENIPQLTPVIAELREEMRNDMDDASGLQQAAQGVEGPDVKSGIHAQTIVQEALKALSDMRDNVQAYSEEIDMLDLVLSAAFCEVPQMLTYSGPDDATRVREWSRTDFGDTRVVTTKAGSMTMYTLLAKKEMADGMLAAHAIDGDEYKDLLSGGVSPILGMNDHPALLRVKGQIETYEAGPQMPPEQLAQQFAAWQQATTQFAQAQQMAQTTGGSTTAPPALAQFIQGPFTRLPVDLEPVPAKVRHRQISRAMMRGKFAQFPQPWQEVLLAEYAEMKNAAGVMTVPETQAANAQAAQQKLLIAQTPKVAISAKADETSIGADVAATQQAFQHPSAQPAAQPA